MKSIIMSLVLFLGAAFGLAQTITVGPTGQYPSPCAAFAHLVDGATVQIDANAGTPYTDTSDCYITNNNVTVVGVNGRPILDASNAGISKGIWVLDGHDIVINNFEFRHANNQNSSSNAAGLRIEDSDGQGGTTPAGGNITVEHCYIHDNFDGVLGANAGSGNGEWYSANPFITFEYDEFQNNGDGSGSTHNIYIGYGGNLTFTLEYSWSHDSYIGHTVKTRAPINNILYNLVGDAVGNSSYILDLPPGGSTYIVGNILYKAAACSSCNQAMVVWSDESDATSTDPLYGPPNQDLHFINNTVLNDPANTFPPQFVSSECFNASSNTCPAPTYGAALTTPGVFENNIFLGPATAISNQPSAVVSNNIVEANTPANLAALFVDAAHFNYHLIAGSPAIGAGLYPPTNNSGAADPEALPVYEYLQVVGDVARPTPSGTTMDEGAYSYPRVDTPPNLTVTTSSPVTVPNTGTITVTGLPTPPAGQYNTAAFVSENPAVIPEIYSAVSATGTVTGTFQTLAVASTTVVPVDVYANGAHVVANITVVAGAPVLNSVTLDGEYYPQSSVNLLGGSTTPITVNLSSSNSSVLYVPSSVTIPAGQLTAETGSINGSLWGQTPASQNATLTATYGGVTKTLVISVLAPFIHDFFCDNNPCTVTGGQPVSLGLIMAGDYPPGGGPISFTSDTPSVIPNQSITAPEGQFNNYINVNTNSVTASTTVNVTINVNGSTGTVPVVVNPGGPTPANIAAVSGSGQSAQVGTSFASPLVALVTSSSGTAVSGATVTFAGSGVSFPSGATAVTNSSGQASVTAQPTATGSLTVTASVSGVSTPASFSETGTAAVAVSSITLDSTYYPGTTVHLTAPAPAGGAVVSLSSSNSSVVYAPATVTVPAGQTLAETGTLLGSLWGQSPSTQTATLTATYGGATATLTNAYLTLFIHSFACNTSPCTVVGGQQLGTTIELAGEVPYGGATITFSSDTPSVIPNQSLSEPAGASYLGTVNLNTNAVSSNTTVNVTMTINGTSASFPVTVTPGANAPANIAAVSGSGQSAQVGTSFTNPLVVLVTNSSGSAVSGATVTFAGSGVSFPSGATAVTNSSGHASVTAQPTATGSLTVTASVSGVSTPASFSETGTAAVAVSSITLDSTYYPGTTVHLTAPAPAGGAVVSLSSSNSSVVYAPATVTVPAGQTLAETGTLLGSLWGQSPSTQTATLTATYGGATATLTNAYLTLFIHSFACNTSPCTVVGGQQLGTTIELAGEVPYGGATITFSSDTPSVIPNQSLSEPAGASYLGTVNLNTNAVSSNTTVNVTMTINGTSASFPVTVNP